MRIPERGRLTAEPVILGCSFRRVQWKADPVENAVGLGLLMSSLVLTHGGGACNGEGNPIPACDGYQGQIKTDHDPLWRCPVIWDSGDARKPRILSPL